jgi:hypothetical protein
MAAMRNYGNGGRRLGIVACLLLIVGCARNQMLLDVRGSVMYEKPNIQKISYTVADDRPDQGAFVVAVSMTGDPGLVATFDITPGIVSRQPMQEVQDGKYEGKFTFAPDVFGGPYWITGRVWHQKAGEHLLRDPAPLMITVPSR